jgi:hypothetical protein
VFSCTHVSTDGRFRLGADGPLVVLLDDLHEGGPLRTWPNTESGHRLANAYASRLTGDNMRAINQQDVGSTRRVFSYGAVSAEPDQENRPWRARHAVLAALALGLVVLTVVAALGAFSRSSDLQGLLGGTSFAAGSYFRLSRR